MNRRKFFGFLGKAAVAAPVAASVAFDPIKDGLKNNQLIVETFRDTGCPVYTMVPEYWDMKRRTWLDDED